MRDGEQFQNRIWRRKQQSSHPRSVLDPDRADLRQSGWNARLSTLDGRLVDGRPIEMA